MSRVAAGRGIITPADIANLVSWHESIGSGLITSGSGISQWTDLSGNGNHAVQATDGNRPTIGTVNGINSVKYSANGHYLASPTGSTNGDHTLFAICRWVGVPGGVTRGVVCWGDTGGANSYISRATDSTLLYGDPAASANGIVAVNNTVYLLSKVRQSTVDVGQRGRQNMGEDARVLTAPGGVTTPNIGIGKDASGNTAINGDIFAVVTYSRALTFGEVVAVERYLAQKFSAVLPL